MEEFRECPICGGTCYGTVHDRFHLPDYGVGCNDCDFEWPNISDDPKEVRDIFNAKRHYDKD